MPYLTLTLNGYPVDLPADAAVALSYRANDLRNLDSREAAFSETFTLPLTARNSAVLGQPHSLDSLTDTPYQLLPTVLTSPGGVVILNGFCLLESAGEGYGVTLTDALGGLFAQVGEAELRDLAMPAYSHTLGYAAVLDAQARDYRQGYTYALADNGRLATRSLGVGVTYYELTLATYYHAVLTAIVAAALPGYQVIGSLLAEQLYQEATLPQPGGYLRLSEARQTQLSAKGRTDTARTFLVNSSNGDTRTATVQLPVGANFPYFAGTSYAAPTYPIDLSIKVHLLVRLTARTQVVPVTSVLALVRDLTQGNGADPYGQLGAATIFTGGSGGVPAGVQVVDFKIDARRVEPLAQLALQLVYSGADVTVLPGSTIEWSVGARVYPGAPVELPANLPDLKQSDFLKLVYNEFNLLIQADPIYQTVRFDLFNDVDRHRDRAVDWTTKLDLTRRPRLSTVLGDYAQRNTLHHDDAPEAYAELFATDAEATGSAELLARNATLPKRAEVYAAPVVLPLERAALGTSLPWLPFYEADAEDAPAELYDNQKTYTTQAAPVVYGGTRWQAAPPPPFVQIDAGNPPSRKPVPVRDSFFSSSTEVAWQVLEEKEVESELATVARVVARSTNVVVREDAPSTLRFTAGRVLSRTGLGFEELLPVYYPVLAAILHRVQVLVLDVRLTALDIANLNYTIPVRVNVPHIQGYGQLAAELYLNNIDQYLPSEPGAVECAFLVLGTPVAGLAPAVPNPPLRPLRYLATEELNIVGTEDARLLLADNN